MHLRQQVNEASLLYEKCISTMNAFYFIDPQNTQRQENQERLFQEVISENFSERLRHPLGTTIRTMKSNDPQW